MGYIKYTHQMEKMMMHDKLTQFTDLLENQ